MQPAFTGKVQVHTNTVRSTKAAAYTPLNTHPTRAAGANQPSLPAQVTSQLRSRCVGNTSSTNVGGQAEVHQKSSASVLTVSWQVHLSTPQQHRAAVLHNSTLAWPNSSPGKTHRQLQRCTPAARVSQAPRGRACARECCMHSTALLAGPPHSVIKLVLLHHSVTRSCVRCGL